MCEPTGIRQKLKDIPFKVASLVEVAPQGSHQRELIKCVVDSVRHDIEYALKRLDSGLTD
mgnify:CR=1 FL=1|tara:strand:+ start:43199 stop:43378 length:180 start_codon:yes stop_codon:yes gene_type:complete